jgi:RimJ/RimL family protein N-acetyltransferase
VGVTGDGPVLHTARLMLRPPRVEDFDGWAAFAADPHATRFIGGPQPRPVAWRAFVALAGSWSLYGFGMFSVLERTSGRWLGRLGPWRPDGWPGNEIGWGLVTEAQGQGLAYEGLLPAIEWAFDVLGWTEMIHCIDDGNVRSEALATRLGSTPLRRTVLPPPSANEITVWGQTRDAWRARVRRAGVKESPDGGHNAAARKR